MKVGDLVRPILCCSGQAGDVRCATAIVVTAYQMPYAQRAHSFIICCDCGMSQVDPVHLELVSESR